MKNKKLYLIFTLILFIFSIASKKYYVSASNTNKEYSIQYNLYIENENFKVVYIGEDTNIMPINSLKIIDKKTNKIIDDEIWSSAILLKNSNFILGKFNNGKYSYYEMNKQGEKNFLIDLDYYIKEIDNTTGNYIIIEKDILNNEYKLGILDKEFNILFKPIFEYKKVDFKNDVEILKISNGKYGVYSSLGKEIIPPIFDSLKFNDETKNLITAKFKNNTYTLEKTANNEYKNITTIKTLDNWAKKSILNTINLGLVSHNLQLKFKDNITREEFCELIINLYEIKTGIEIDISKNENPFLDTDSKYILKAYKLNLILGKAKNIFEPKSFITREEAAVIIANLIKAMGNSPKENIKNYSDKDLISNWAYSSVMLVSSENIMQGNNNFFKPKDNITTQEALVIIDRIY